MLANIIWQQKKTVIYTILAGTVSGLTAVALFAQSGLLISKAALLPPFYTILILAAFLKLFGVAKSSSKYAERLLSHEVTFHMMSRVRESYFQKLLGQTALFTKHKSGDLLERITADVETLQHTFLRVTYPPLVAGAVFFATILFTLLFSWQIALTLMIGYGVVAFIIPFVFAKWLVTEQQTRGDVTNALTDTLYGYETYKHNNLLVEKTEQLLQTSEHYERQQMKLQQKLATAHAVNQFTSLAIAVLTLLLAIVAVSNGSLDAVYIAMLLMVALTVFDTATPLANAPYYVAATKEATARLEQLTEQPNGTITVEQVTPITLYNVTFAYPESLYATLTNVSLTVTKGEKVAFIGESGSGKSTIMHMLMKELTPIAGSITMNGVDLQAIEEHSLFEHISVQLQHNHFFVGTVRDNLHIANDEATDDEMQELLQYVELPCSLDDVVEEKALNFSGGERQRLAFARLLLQKAPVMLLDEPFSSIDVRLKRKFMDHLVQMDATIIVITHDTDSLQQFDTIYHVAEQAVRLH